jgi:hypothetical protein
MQYFGGDKRECKENKRNGALSCPKTQKLVGTAGNGKCVQRRLRNAGKSELESIAIRDVRRTGTGECKAVQYSLLIFVGVLID